MAFMMPWMPAPLPGLQKPATALTAPEDPNLAMLSPVARDAVKAKRKKEKAALPQPAPVNSVLS